MALGFIDDVLDDLDVIVNEINNEIENEINPIINDIDRWICPDNCWSTDPVNISNWNIAVSGDPGKNIVINAPVVDLSFLVIEEAAPFSTLMCAQTTEIENYAQVLLGYMPDSISTLTETSYDYQKAVNHCATRGGHVCSTSEVYELAGTGAPGDIDYQLGDWLAGGTVVAAPGTRSLSVFETEWPPIQTDLSPLLSVPPGLPLGLSVPVAPTGSYRCCTASIDF